MTSYLKKLTSSSIWFSLVLNIYGCNKIKENQIYNFKEQEQYQANMQRALNKYTTAQEIIGSIELNLGSLSKTATDLKPLINKQFNNIIKQQVGSLKIKSLKLSNYHKALVQDNDFTGNIKYEHQEIWKPEFFHPEMLFVFYSDITLQSTIFPNLVAFSFLRYCFEEVKQSANLYYLITKLTLPFLLLSSLFAMILSYYWIFTQQKIINFIKFSLII